MLSDFICLTADREKLIDYLIQHGVLPATTNCNKCESIIYLNKETLMFTCNKKYFVKNVHKKRICVQCNFKRSARTGTWFDKSPTDIKLICRLTEYFIILPPPRIWFLTLDTSLAKSTVIDWLNFCREVCVNWAEKHIEKLGGPGHTVEVDEAKSGRRKYNRGRVVEGHWIFGGIDRESKKIFLVPVEDRTQETLLKCIKENILKGSIIISDCWKAYNCLQNEDFQHLTVNHSYNFVDPDTGAHTQNIERIWREVRANIPKYGIISRHFVGYLSEYLFKRDHILENRIDIFFDLIGQLYPPKLDVQCQQQASSSNCTES